MPTSPDLPLAFGDASAATLRRLAAALRSGQLLTPVTPFGLARVATVSTALERELQRLTAEGLSAAHLTTMLDLAAAAVEARMLRDSHVELVWTGPEALHARSRDTLVVLDELFSSAQRSVLISTYVVHDPSQVFATLGARLDAVPALHVKLFLHIERERGDTRVDTALLNEFAASLATGWPGTRRPEVYYDRRGLSLDREVRASWHAKCVLVDDEVAFVTSANFTEWAQRRNVEAGALIRSPHFTCQLRAQLESLVQSQHLKRLAGF
jgi:phosphatidylserine/phosphatidylglycerophosphate/cardiolipin synthase-like enzyme